MQKNVAGQKITVFAWDVANGVPKTGDAGNITAYIWQDSASGAASDDTNPTELDSTNAPGLYVFDLTQAETNAGEVSLYAVSSTTDISIKPVILYTNLDDATSTALTAIIIATGTILGDTNELQTDWTDGGRLDLLLDALQTVEGSISLVQAVQVILASTAGKTTISGQTVNFRDQADSKNRIVAVTDTDDQRTAITTSLD